MGNADPKNQGALNLVDKRMISTEKLSEVQVSIKYHSLITLKNPNEKRRKNHKINWQNSQKIVGVDTTNTQINDR